MDDLLGDFRIQKKYDLWSDFRIKEKSDLWSDLQVIYGMLLGFKKVTAFSYFYLL